MVTPAPGQPQQRQPDGQVDSYERVVSGKVIKVNAYAKKSTTTTRAAAAVRKRPGRPRIAAKPGSYSSGRDIPGVKAISLPPEPPQFPRGVPNGPGQPAPNPNRRGVRPQER